MAKHYVCSDEVTPLETTHLEGADSMKSALEMAGEWCRGGDWGIEGAEISVYVEERDENGEMTNHEWIMVTIEPDHDALIRRAGGNPDCDHDWTSEGEGGCRENPGVWSTGGTGLVTKDHCRSCGLHRTEHYRGSQRNPGETESSYEYHQPDNWCADCEREECSCNHNDE